MRVGWLGVALASVPLLFSERPELLGLLAVAMFS